MKRWILLAVLVVAVSAGATILVGNVPIGTEADPDELIKIKHARTGPLGKLLIEGDATHNFGVMPQEDTGHYTWTIRNVGKGDLILTKKGSTCKCTIANLAEGEHATIKPGGQTEIRLSWETKQVKGEFAQSATIGVENDADLDEIQLGITGKVTPPIVTAPEEARVDLGPIPNDAPFPTKVALASPDRPDMKIESVKVGRPDLIKVNPSPLTEDEQKGLRMGPGYKLEIEVTPGNELTNFSDEITVFTDHPKQKEIVFTVTGRIIGPISVVPSHVRAYNVPGRDGGEATAALWVRGQDQTHFTVEKAPGGLKVDITPDDANLEEKGKGRRYRMTAKVPPGTPPGLISGDIVLKTDHPKADVVKIPVDILVSNAQ